MPDLNPISLLAPANPLNGGEFLVVDQQQGATISVAAISVGLPYRILDLGNTNWAAVGAGPSAAVGTVFVASAVGTGTGTVVRLETRRGTIADVSASTIALISSAGLVLPVLTVEGIATIDEVHGGLTGKVFTHVKNTSGGSLSQLTPCKVAGSVGDTTTLQVVAARADNGGLMPAAGILASTLANNGEGHMVIGGVLAGVNTAAWTSGADLFVAPAGGLTATRPTANAQRIATVGRSHATTGSLLVQVGPSLATVAYSGAVADVSGAASFGMAAGLAIALG